MTAMQRLFRLIFPAANKPTTNQNNKNNMSPALLALIVSIMEELFKIAPGMIAEFRTLFALQAPTPADFEALRQKITGESYYKFVPGSSLPGNPSPTATNPTPPTLAASIAADVAQVSPPGPAAGGGQLAGARSAPTPEEIAAAQVANSAPVVEKVLQPGEFTLPDGSVHTAAPPVPTTA